MNLTHIGTLLDWSGRVTKILSPLLQTKVFLGCQTWQGLLWYVRVTGDALSVVCYRNLELFLQMCRQVSKQAKSGSLWVNCFMSPYIINSMDRNETTSTSKPIRVSGEIRKGLFAHKENTAKSRKDE